MIDILGFGHHTVYCSYSTPSATVARKQPQTICKSMDVAMSQ